MKNLAAIKTKSSAHYQCQKCGATELIQAHHEISGDDSSLVALCAECHSKKHPDLPRALFFTKSCQPYWHNKSASSLAKQWGASSRTIIRATKRLGIQSGELSSWDEELIRNNIPKLNSRARQLRLRRQARLVSRQLTEQLEEQRALKGMQPGDVLSVRDAAREVGAHFTTLYRQVQKGKIVYVTFGGNIFIPVLEVERLKREKEKRAAGVSGNS